MRVVKTVLLLGKKPGTGSLVGLLGRVRKMSPIGIWSLDRPARSKSLYWLSYLGPFVQYDVFLIIKTNNMHMQSIIIIIIIGIGIQPLGRSGQRPEFSQATGMALVRCILGKFLGIVYHCFPPCKVIYIYLQAVGFVHCCYGRNMYRRRFKNRQRILI